MELLSPHVRAKFPHFSQVQQDDTLVRSFQEWMPNLEINSQAVKGIFNSSSVANKPLQNSIAIIGF